MDSAQQAKRATAWGVLCGLGAAGCWAAGFVAARHGVIAGLSPLLIALHRFVWPGLVLLPFVIRAGFGNLGGIGWRRGIAITALGALPFSILSYSGFMLVPLGHGSVIQPSCAAIAGLLLARFTLKEPLPRRRMVGAIGITIGRCGI